MPLSSFSLESSHDSLQTPIFKKRQKLSNLPRQTSDYLKKMNDSLNGIDKELNELKTPRKLVKSKSKYSRIDSSPNAVRVPLNDESPKFKRKGTPKKLPEYKLIDDDNRFVSPNILHSSFNKSGSIVHSINNSNGGLIGGDGAAALNGSNNQQDIEFDSSDIDDENEKLEQIIPYIDKSHISIHPEEQEDNVEKSKILYKINQTISEIKERDLNIDYTISKKDITQALENSPFIRNRHAQVPNSIQQSSRLPQPQIKAVSDIYPKFSAKVATSPIQQSTSPHRSEYTRKRAGSPLKDEIKISASPVEIIKNPTHENFTARSISESKSPIHVPNEQIQIERSQSPIRGNNVTNDWKTEWESSKWNKLNQLINTIPITDVLNNELILTKLDISKQELSERIDFLKEYNDIKMRKKIQLKRENKKKILEKSLKKPVKKIGKVGNKNKKSVGNGGGKRTL